MDKITNKFNEKLICIFLFGIAVTELLYAGLSNYVFADLAILFNSNEQTVGVAVIVSMISFILCLIAGVLFEILLIYRVAKRMAKLIEKYVAVLNGVLLILLLCNAKYFSLVFRIFKAEVFKSYSDSDYSALMRFVFNGGFGGNGFLIFTILMDIAFIVLAVVGFYRVKNFGYALHNESGSAEDGAAEPLINKEDIEAGVEKAKQLSSSVADKTKSTTTNVVSKIKEMSPQTKKKAIAAIVAVVVLVAGIGIYNGFFNYDKIDLMANLSEPTFSGFDGEGIIEEYPSQGKIDYDLTNEGVETFLYDVSYTVDKTEGLSNGDEVTVTAQYSEQTAKALKLKVTNDTVKVKVSGLTERFKDGNEISKEDLDIVKKAMDEEAEDRAEYWNIFREGKVHLKRLALLFAKEEKNDYNNGHNDMLVGIYQVVRSDETGYFVVESNRSINGDTDFEHLAYYASSVKSHFVYGLEDYLKEDAAYTLTEIGADEKKNDTAEKWYSSSLAAAARVIYPVTVYPSVRPDNWEVIVKKNVITYEYTYDTKFDADAIRETRKEIEEAMKDEESVFEDVLAKIEKDSGVKTITLKIKYSDKKGTVIYERDFKE